MCAAMNTRTPASAACGTYASSPEASSITAMTAPIATSAATWDDPPAALTIAVRGGLLSTGNAPKKPAMTFPAPTAKKSPLLSSLAPACAGNERPTAAVCMTQTAATTSVSGAIAAKSPGFGNAGMLRAGSVIGNAPSM